MAGRARLDEIEICRVDSQQLAILLSRDGLLSLSSFETVVIDTCRASRTLLCRSALVAGADTLALARLSVHSSMRFLSAH
jgi:hypothetical protein